jgi:long-chain acyl-CoA synthetase
MLDREGFLYLVDRKADVILKAGFPVYPSEVEAVLAQHHKIEACTVIGVPDRAHGEEVKAYIVLRPNQTSVKEEMVEFCKSRLAFYKCPRHVDFVESLPHSVTGKVLKHLLREKKPAPAPVATPESQPAVDTAAGKSEVAPAEESVPTAASTVDESNVQTTTS